MTGNGQTGGGGGTYHRWGGFQNFFKVLGEGSAILQFAGAWQPQFCDCSLQVCDLGSSGLAALKSQRVEARRDLTLLPDAKIFIPLRGDVATQISEKN